MGYLPCGITALTGWVNSLCSVIPYLCRRGTHHCESRPLEDVMTNSKWLSRIALCTALAGGLMLSTVGIARADDKDDCNRRLEADRARIDRDITHHGEHSHQVDRDRDKMDADRKWC